jgi:TIR domain-containing protein
MALLRHFGRRPKLSGVRGEADVQRTSSDLPRLTQSGRGTSSFAPRFLRQTLQEFIRLPGVNLSRILSGGSDLMASDPAEPAGDETKAKIFISYSRKDMGFVDRLEVALKARGVEPLIDRTEIYAFEDWWKRVEALVSQADTIVFVLSPDSVSSEVALREVAFATSLNKRFAPIVVRRVDVNTVPEALRKLNFIFFDFDTQFEGSADRLAEALRTDIGWIRKHTEFVESARRWAVAGRPGPRGLLLRSPVLEEAERWIASRPEGAPSPTEEAQAFIAESRRAATQRRNILSGNLAAGLLVALGLAGLAYWQRGIAVEQRDKALVTQSRFLADLSRQLAERGDQVSAALLGMEALPDPKSTVFRPLVPEAQTAFYQSLSTLRELAVLSAPGTKIAAASASDDGSRIMTLQEDRTVRVWDAKTNRLLATHGPFLAENSSAKRLVTGLDRNSLEEAARPNPLRQRRRGGRLGVVLLRSQVNCPLRSKETTRSSTALRSRRREPTIQRRQRATSRHGARGASHSAYAAFGSRNSVGVA